MKNIVDYLKVFKNIETYKSPGPRNMAQGGRMNFQFGGGVDAQTKGTEASRVYFKNRPVKIPTPVFEGPAGGAKLTDVKFANKTQEAEYIKLLKERFKFPRASNEAKKVVTNEALAKKFGMTLNNVERVNSALKKKFNLEYPAQTYEGVEKIQRERDKIRKENIKKTSSTGVESKIKRDIKKVDATALANDVDVAHRASLKANANLGADYLTTSLGIDSKIINRSIIRPTEQKLGKLYNDQKNLIKDYKPGDKIPKDIQKKLEKVNIKISELADRTNGVLQGVLVDEKTLKPRIYGIDYSKVLGFGLVDKPVSELTQADRDLIKLNVGEQIKTAKKEVKKILQSFCGYGKSTGGRIGFKSGSCSTEVAQRNFLLATNDVAKGRVTGEAAEQIAKNAGMVVAKAGSKSALASIFGPAGIGIDLAYEVGSIGFDMATDSNVSLKQALQNNWLTGAFIPGTGQEEYNKGLVKFDSSATPMATIQNLIEKIESEEKNLEQIKTSLVRGDYSGEAKKEILAKQEALIKNLYNDFDKVAKRKNEGPRGENVRYLALEEGSPERIAFDQAKQEYDSIGEAKALLKKPSKHGFEQMIKEGAQKRPVPFIDYSLIPEQYGKYNKNQLDEILKDYTYGPYVNPKTFGFSGYGDLSNYLSELESTHNIAQAGGVSKLAGGGMAGIRRPSAIPPESGPMSQGLRSLYNNGRKL